MERQRQMEAEREEQRRKAFEVRVSHHSVSVSVMNGCYNNALLTAGARSRQERDGAAASGGVGEAAPAAAHGREETA